MKSITLTAVTKDPDHCDNEKCPFFITMKVPEDYEDWADFCTAPIYSKQGTAQWLGSSPNYLPKRTPECKTTFT